MQKRFLAVLLLAYLLPGLFGHEPWKPDEPYTFGVAREMLQSHDWIVPRVGDLPFVEKPPLFYWVTSAAMYGASHLAPPDAARLASALFIFITLGATALAARLCWGPGAASRAALLLLATVGLEGHAQRLQVDHALMAGFAVAVLGFAACASGRWWAGIAIGAGVAMGFLSKGLIAPGAIGLTALLLPALFSAWRTRRYAEQLAYAALIAIPLVVGWPAALYLRDPVLFDAWFWDNNFGRFMGYATGRLGATSEPGWWSATLGWFLFPASIYAAAFLLRARRAAWTQPAVQVGGVLTAVMAAVLLASASFRAVYALPMLPPLVVFATGAALEQEGRLARVMGAAAIAIAVAGAAFIWWIWAVLLATGDVPAWTGLSRHLPLPFTLGFDFRLFGAAALLTLGFAALVALRPRLQNAALASWAGMLALGWGLVMTLWLPWLDAAKGYHGVFAEMAAHIDGGERCIVTRGLGESERAMLAYYTGVKPIAAGAEDDCGELLWMGSATGRRWEPSPETWLSVWSGSRPGERSERFELFVKRRRRGF